jgi:hypothetical protein
MALFNCLFGDDINGAMKQLAQLLLNNYVGEYREGIDNIIG